MRRLPLPLLPRLLPLLLLLACICPTTVFGTQQTLRTVRRNVRILSEDTFSAAASSQGLHAAEPALHDGRLEVQKLLRAPGRAGLLASGYPTQGNALLQNDEIVPLQPRLSQAEHMMWNEIRAVENNQKSLAQLQVYQESLDAQQAAMEAEQRQMISDIPLLAVGMGTGLFGGILGDTWLGYFLAYFGIIILFVICLDVYGVIRHPAQADKQQREEFTMPQLKDPVTDKYHPLSAMVLSSWGDKDWNGMVTLSVDERKTLLNEIEGSNWGGNNALDVEEIISFISQPDNVEKVKRLPACIHGILNEELVREVVKKFDHDQSGELDAEEWNMFIEEIESQHMDFLLEEAFQGFRAFYGRGQDWQDPPGKLGNERQLRKYNLRQAAGIPVNLLDIASPDDLHQPSPRVEEVQHPKQFQIGCDPDTMEGRVVPPGWAEDFWFYSANVHPFHGMFACDPTHPFSRSERCMIEMAVLMIMCLAYLIKVLVEQGNPPLGLTMLENPNVFKVLVITLPSLIWWWSLFLLFTCPCVRVDRSQATSDMIEKAELKNMISQGIGYVVVLAAMIGFCWMIFNGIMPAEFLLTVAWSRVQAYFISWALMVALPFNPVAAWGQTDPDANSFVGWFGDNVGLGQWRVEKQRFRAICLQALKKQHEEEDEERISRRLRSGILTLFGPKKAQASAS